MIKISSDGLMLKKRENSLTSFPYIPVQPNREDCHFEPARFIFNSIPFKNLFSYNAMLLAYSLHHQTTSFLNLFSSFPPSLRRRERDGGGYCGVQLDRRVSREVREFGGCPNGVRRNADERWVTCSTMISGYVSYGFINQAMELFHQVQNPVLWNAVIGGLVQNNSFHHVLDLLQDMQKAGFRPNSVTISCVLPAVSLQHSSLRTVKQMHWYAVRNGCDRNI